MCPKCPKSAPRWAQEGSKNHLAAFANCAAALFGLSWALRGPSVGGRGGHLEVNVGLGRLASGVQGGQKLRWQEH